MEQNNHIHSFEDIVVPSTCKQQGFTLHKCACGYEHKDNFKPLADHDFETVGGTEPTCTEGGSKTLRCKVCGVEKTEPTPANGHAWGDWNIQEYATCTEEGKQFRFCGMCGLREDQTIPAKGHKLTDPKKSETEEGMVEYFCENCGNTIVQPSAKSKAKRFFAAHKKGLKALIALFVVIAIASTLLLTVFAKPFHYHLAKLQIKLGDYTNAYYNLKNSKGYRDAEDILNNDFAVVYEEISAISYDNDGDFSYKRKQTYDKYGNMLSRTTYNESGTSTSSYRNEYEYDKRGRLLRVEGYDSQEGLSAKREFEYDKKGNRISETIYNALGDITHHSDSEYDDRGNVIKTYGYDVVSNSENKKTYFNTEFEYDEKDNVILRINYEEDGSIRSKRVYEYDKKGNLLLMESRDADGNITAKVEYEYDKYGNEILEVGYDSDGNITNKTENEFDRQGNLVYSLKTSYDGTSSREYVREKTKNGSKATEKYYNSDGEYMYKHEYEYDKHGNEILYEYYGEDGTLKSQTKSEYDKKGNLIKYEYFYLTTFGDVTQETRTVCKYEYDKKGNPMVETVYQNGKRTLRTEVGKAIIVYLPDNNSYIGSEYGY